MFKDLSPFYPTRQGVRITLKVTPKAARNRIGDVMSIEGANILKVYVNAPPTDGKANAAVVELLSDAWDIPKSAMQIVQGAHDRTKVVEIIGDSKDLMKKLNLMWG